MTNRKFTPPTEFPAEYVDGKGNKAVILVRGPHKMFPLIGYDCDGEACAWTMEGTYAELASGPDDLHDIPKRITTWHNVYYDRVGHQCSTGSEADEFDHRFAHADRQCVYRIERDENGSNPKIFVEKLWLS
jgi:hypothetical protein